MKPSLSPDNISYVDYKGNLGMYETYLPAKIEGLEKLRLEEVPEVLEMRRKDGDAFLEKTEVTALVKWKLCVPNPPSPQAPSLPGLTQRHSKHGTYRPNLAKLVAQNKMQDVRTTTKNAFKEYAADNSKFAKSITALSKLKGIGPASASLLLSCYDPAKVPFFSDELFRYMHWSDANSKGWDRKISYTMKEYKDLFEKVQVLRERLEKESGQVVKAIDIEKCAYALAKGVQEYHKHGGVSNERPCRSPNFDGTGCGVDYNYLSICPGRSRPLGKKATAELDKKVEEIERKQRITLHTRIRLLQRQKLFGTMRGEKFKVRYNEVAIKEYEGWQRNGFHAELGEFEKSLTGRTRQA
ncbi:hypothetical protein MMC29_006996 [Sticta canariensis]|nr:hypothetical protein [Sticta canariensis]